MLRVLEGLCESTGYLDGSGQERDPLVFAGGTIHDCLDASLFREVWRALGVEPAREGLGRPDSARERERLGTKTGAGDLDQSSPTKRQGMWISQPCGSSWLSNPI